MNGRIPEPRPRTVLYKRAREKLLDFARSLEPTTASPAEPQSTVATGGTRVPEADCEASVQDRDNPVQAPTPGEGRKRRRDIASGSEPSFPKRPRLTGPRLQQLPPQGEQADSDPKAKAHNLVISWLESLEADGSPPASTEPRPCQRDSCACTRSHDASATPPDVSASDLSLQKSLVEELPRLESGAGEPSAELNRTDG